MAKQPPAKSRTSRIRFIMLDAEISEGDLSQITSAIQNALKPTAIIQQRLPSQSAAPALIDNSGGGEINGNEAIEVEEQQAALTESPKAPRTPRVRKPKTPDVLELDFTSGVSLKSFAEQHPPTSELERNLVIAAWFKECRDLTAVTAAHVYTGYRHLKWSTGFADFSVAPALPEERQAHVVF
ncbi:MAG TPA: hypothetical protein VJ779_16645 [Acetobacteraceae bacterium]|nr:hypothetical protein [Acetobacteraceae bacterium]